MPNGGKRPGAGCPKGFKHKKTLEKEAAREFVRQLVTQHDLPALARPCGRDGGDDDARPPHAADGEWIGQQEILRQLLACWLVVDDKDLPLAPRLVGAPGIGKTSLAMRVAYELNLRFQPDSPDAPADGSVVLALIDGGDIARSRYGESEERIREVFTRAQKGFTDPSQRTIVLFDDVESILMARGSSNAKEWHFSQDSVFFHMVDELDTSRTAVFLTTNRPDLVDDAIRDRFLSYSLGTPDADLLVEKVTEFVDRVSPPAAG